jgi:hypothetical protein
VPGEKKEKDEQERQKRNGQIARKSRTEAVSHNCAFDRLFSKKVLQKCVTI